MKCTFLGVDVLKLSLCPFVWHCLKKPIEVREFSSSVKNVVSPAKTQKRNEILYLKIDFLLHYDSWKEADLLGNLLTCIDFFC